MAEATEKKTTRKSTKMDAELVEKLVQDAMQRHMSEFFEKLTKDMQAKVDENKPEVIRTDKAETQVYTVGGETFISLPMVEGIGVDALYPFKNGTVLLTSDAYKKAKNAIQALGIDYCIADIDYCIADTDGAEEVAADDDIDADCGADIEEIIKAHIDEYLEKRLAEHKCSGNHEHCGSRKSGDPRFKVYRMSGAASDIDRLAKLLFS